MTRSGALSRELNETRDQLDRLRLAVRSYLREMDNTIAPDYRYRASLRDRLRELVPERTDGAA